MPLRSSTGMIGRMGMSRRRPWTPLWGVALVLARATPLLADPTAPPSSQPSQPSQPAQPSGPALGFDSVSRGAVGDVGLGTSKVGDTLMGELGGEWLGLETLGAAGWLLQWDALAAAKGGYLAHAHPFTLLLGGHVAGWGELGYRFEPSAPWSLYAGARLGGDLQLMASPGVSLSALDTINNVDGVGGLNATGVARACFGTSFLDGTHSLLLVAFLQAALRGSQTNTPGAVFADGGVEARFDVAQRLTLSLDALWGTTGTSQDAALGRSDQTTHAGITASFRKIFANGMWLGVAAGLAQERDHAAYSGGGSYDTANAPTFGLTLTYGFPLGAQ